VIAESIVLTRGISCQGNFEPDSVFTSEFGTIVNETLSGGGRKPLPDGYGNDIDNTFLRGRVEKNGFPMGFTFWDRNEGLGSEVVAYEYFANTQGVDFRAHHRGYAGYATYTLDLSPQLTSTSRSYFRSDRILPATGFTYTYQYQSVSNGTDATVSDKKKGYHGEGFVAGFEQQMNIEVDRHHLVLGLQLEQEILEHNGISLGSEQDSESTHILSTWPNEVASVQPVFFSQNGALYVQDEIPFGSHVTLSGGVRFDADDEYGHAINPRFGLVRSPPEGIGFKGLYSEAFKSPTVFEQFDEFRGNQNLDPEQISTVEGEINFQAPRKAYLRANVFYNHLKDLIQVAPNLDPTRFPIGP
jgi:outer membrane receptor protein involved in Fe transport